MQEAFQPRTIFEGYAQLSGGRIQQGGGIQGLESVWTCLEQKLTKFVWNLFGI